MSNCPICGLPKERSELGLLRPVHLLRRAGTLKWCQWFEKLPEGRKTTEGRLLFLHAMKGKRESAERKTRAAATSGKVNSRGREQSSERWKQPQLIARYNAGSARWLMGVMDRPLSEAKEGTCTRIVPVDGAGRKGFDDPQEARRWWKQHQFDLLPYIKSKLAANQYTTFRITSALQLCAIELSAGRKEQA